MNFVQHVWLLFEYTSVYKYLNVISELHVSTYQKAEPPRVCANKSSSSSPLSPTQVWSGTRNFPIPIPNRFLIYTAHVLIYFPIKSVHLFFSLPRFLLTIILPISFSLFGNCPGDSAILGQTRRARDDRRVGLEKMPEFKTGLNVRRFLNKKKKTVFLKKYVVNTSNIRACFKQLKKPRTNG